MIGMSQYTLSGRRRIDLLTEVSIETLQYYEPPEGYFLAFSGGKDSIVIHDLAKRAEVLFDAHYNDITVDPPEVRKFIRMHYPNVIWDQPRRSMYDLIRHKRVLPTRIMRYCHSELKGRSGAGRIVVTGVRRSESITRRGREVLEKCRGSPKKWFLQPILSWTAQDVWDYIKDQDLAYCSLYDEGWDRLGCIMCPMQGTKGMLRDSVRYPEHYERYLEAIKDMLNASHARGEESKHGTTPKEIMHWWIHNADLDTATKQTSLFAEAV